MSSPVHTTSDSLSKLVRWAHSHGTICSLIPSLHHLTRGFCDPVLTPEPRSIPVAVWSCGAGHAYHWPLRDHGDSCRGLTTVSQSQERCAGGHPSNKETVRTSGDLTCSEVASEGEEFSSRLFDIARCDSSATDEDCNYEPRLSRKRGGAAVGAFAVKKVKLETPSAEDNDPSFKTATDDVIVSQAGPALSTHSDVAHALFTNKTLTHSPQSQHEQDLRCEGLVDPEMELLGGGSCMTGTTEQCERCSSAPETIERPAGAQSELERLQALLCAERNHNQQMAEIISSLKQDKELLEHEITKKAELICDFLQDKLQPEKRLHRFSNQMEPGSSHVASPDDMAGFDSPPTMFDSFEEVELQPVEHQQPPKSKRSRDGENTRVRSKDMTLGRCTTPRLISVSLS
ncbi:uncharacterized protein [Antennarius striatus]|uniref:uncharacterized protein isoform X2 n=1 Tax=Antennarius striatus TaxID=241820 RepID=UPI0035B4182E